MPLSYAFDPALRVACFFYGRHFHVVPALETFRRFAAEYKDAGSVRFINLFDRSVDLSALEPELLYALKDELRDILETNGISRERTAFVAGGSREVHLIGPLWGAINATDPDTRFPMAFFDSLDEVPAFFGCDIAPLRALVRRVRD